MCESFDRNYEIYEEIGRGRFGLVHRCCAAVSGVGEFLAVKSIEKRLLLDSTDRECLIKEPKILRFVSPHPNIITIHDLHESETHLLIVTDLCSSVSLFDRLRLNFAFSESDTAESVFIPLMDAIAHCHRLGVAHRDIKPENVLFDSRSGRLKLCDFGSAELFGSELTMRGVVGTPYYVAPEVLSGREYNEKVDVWSAGVILYEMIGGMLPFVGESVEETFEKVLRGNVRFPASLFRNVSPMAKDLLRKMLCRDVNRRFSAEQVLGHPWVVNRGMTSSVLNPT